MGKLIWSVNVTVDGCTDHTQAIADAELHTYAAAVLDGAACLLLGRISYDLLESYWPLVARGEIADADEAQVAFAHQLEAKPKVVASRKLDTVHWNASLIRGDLAEAVQRLKQERGDVLIFGSPGLGSALTQADLIDEHHFLIQPIAAGRGPRLFDGIARRTFRVIETQSFASGVVKIRAQAGERV